MQNISYQISGFKCFNEKSFVLKDVTILTGSNGTGKSSFIQGLLLIRAAIEKNCSDPANDHFGNASWKDADIALNGPYQLNLGSVNDIFNDRSNSGEIKITLDNETFKIKLPIDDSKEDRVVVSLSEVFKNNSLPFWRSQKFYYLNTERLGPRMGVNAVYTDFPHCYYQGENTAKVLFDLGVSEKITDHRQNNSILGNTLGQQVEAWLNLICPGTLGVQVKQHDLNRYQILLRSSAAKNNIIATNIGFGISYALPIIVNGLIAEKDSIYIVENPEAHLHPKGQSNMGYFLGKIAASGIRIIIETHSEHIVNGLRRASLEDEHLPPENVGIYFFEDFAVNSELAREITLSKGGDLESFPKDFFDQVGQDMAELFKLKNMRKDG